MKPPYYRLTARCGNDLCHIDEFTAERKKIVKTGTSGVPYTIERLVCPECRTWGYIIETEEVG